MDRLYWDAYIKSEHGLGQIIDDTSGALHIYLGDVREAVAHSDKISKFGRVIYNASAWDTDKFKEIKDELTQPNHYDVIKEVMFRIEKFHCKKVDLGYLGRWKNPYQIADTHLAVGITVTYIDQAPYFLIDTAFFTPGHWFSIKCKPMFKTDPVVMKDSKGSWNMNPTGLIAAKPEKAAANRRIIFGLVCDFIKEFDPKFSCLSLSKTFYNPETNTGYLQDPEAKENEDLWPLLYCVEDEGALLFSDSTEVPSGRYKAITVGNHKVQCDRKHFDFV